MGVLQPCCFEERKNNRRDGFVRITNSNKSIKDPYLNNYKTNKISPTKTTNNLINNNNSKNQKLDNSSEYMFSHGNKIENEKVDRQMSSYTFHKKVKKHKNKSSSVDISNTLKRNKTYQGTEKYSFHKINFIKGEKIGEGRFGTVYSGLKISNGEIITVKIYKNLTIPQKNRIIENINILNKLEHKNIIKCEHLSQKDIIDENGELNIIYESINLQSVADLIKNFGNLDENNIQRYTKQLLEGLKYLHEKSIYHKNLKPSNILVDSDGNNGVIKISDCLIDSLILGSAQEIYDRLVKEEQIQYYIPPFFIRALEEEKKFDDWKSFDLWCIGCLIIEVAQRKKPWSHYNFKNNLEFFKFLKTTHLIPTIPQKLSPQCQELIKILLNYELTKKENIYDTLFNLDFFKSNKGNGFSSNKNSSKQNDIKSSISDTKFEESENRSQLGKDLEKNNVVNILNNNNNASFTVSYTIEDNSLGQSSLRLSQSILSKGYIRNKNINIKKNEPFTTITEAQVEQSPDPVKNGQENNFNFNK
jgi:serine/threonine protein kinase